MLGMVLFPLSNRVVLGAFLVSRLNPRIRASTKQPIDILVLVSVSDDQKDKFMLRDEKH